MPKTHSAPQCQQKCADIGTLTIIKLILENGHPLSKPRPYDYTVTDILTEADVLAGMYVEDEMERGTEEKYCMGDLDNKQRTKEDYWHVIKLVLEQIDVIAK